MAIPTPDKGIIVNWAIQTNFQLPWNRSQIPVDIFEANSGYVGTARKKRDLELQYRNNAKLYHFYKAIEDIVTGFGHNGQGCVLRTLCQLGAEPLHTTGEDDLLHEIATYVLNPLNDIEDGVSEESMPYIEAVQHGRRHKNCIKIYDNCSLSLIDLFTMFH
ncbi:unnamed protein product [Danaus chrysippus]|uniref:(African queen) hypothetical protein n=1 Tax=Danaus chrysippus TaxID=151541 RepID=A0A8J2QPC0_9NEOP|nr:unnamed protein product [Danaus chrysippus]